MILPRHPDLMSDDELRKWLVGLVSQQTPESTFLDYKGTVATDSRRDKQEIAKDISSFANERGGVVLYGIPQVEEGNEPVPVGVEDIGMDRVAGLPEVIENIVVGALIPRLPELRVREIPLMHLPEDRVVYLVWHPESWEAPHMIHAYREHRYYRRGNFRAVLMEEGEVERLYRRRQARRVLASQFLEQTDFGESLFPQDERLMRIVVCPAFPFDDRVDFAEETTRDWLGRHWPANSQGWMPFIYGVRATNGQPREPEFAEYLTKEETRLFRNGAASYCSDIRRYQESLDGFGFLTQLEYFLHRVVGVFFKQVGMTGDILVNIAFLNANEARFEHGVMGIRYEPRGQDFLWHSHVLQFRVTCSAIDLLVHSERWALEERIMDRLAQCFGLWSIPSYFRPDGSPMVIEEWKAAQMHNQ